MEKEKRMLKYLIGWFIIGILLFLIGQTGVFAATYNTFDVTWYYRNKSNEDTLLNVVKNQDTALYASTSEYVNGYTTRLEQTFSKDIQYIINYELQMSFSPEQELVYRSDTLDRIINYSYTDSDFKILNVTAKEDWNRSSSIGDTFLTIKVSMQVLALNNTNAIRFGVYTTNNISIGFYNHTEQIDYYLLDNISIEENANATIIDQNNQIINGQNGINDNITNSTNTITGSITDTENNITNSITDTENNINQNIDDMEQSIVDSNKENTDKEIESQKVCKNYNYNINNVKKIDGYIASNGNIYDGGSNFKHTDYIPLNKNENYTLSINFNNNNLAYCLYTKDKTLISCERYNIEQTFTINLSEDGYIRYSTRETYDVNFTGKYCENGNQALNDKLDDTNNKLDGIQGALTDTSTPNLEILGDTAGWLPPGPLDSVLNLPLTMMNNLLTNLGKTCSTFRVELPFVNKNIEIPCVESLMEQMGALVLWRWIGRIASVIILYSYLMNLYAWADKILTLRAELDEAMGVDLANWGRL